jgi:2-polyprenyl-6-methoxyphenol hydroxylase-like FAD-dependent oxidoreductase
MGTRPSAGHAVVLGAGMGGLLAARVLADFFATVTVIERDTLPADPRPRRGVPHGRHLHALLPAGRRALDALLPGLVDELLASGVPQAEFLREVRLVYSGHQLTRADIEATAIQATRPLLEGTVRDWVAALTNVKIMDGCAVAGLVNDGDDITGARIRRSTDVEEVLPADLVVDAMGRSGRTRTWLSDLGYEPPAEERIDCGITYVSRFLRMASGSLPADRIVIVGPTPGRPRMMGLGIQEGDRWLLTLCGLAGERPGSDDEGFLAFAEMIAPPDVYAAIRDAEPLTQPVVHKVPASVRRHYERLRRHPRGLLAFGDAICSFNPIYGQGMTVAALEAEALHRVLRAGECDLARRFFRAAAEVIDPAWSLSAGADLALPEIQGPRPLSTRMRGRYIARLHRVAEHDPAVAAAFVRVIALLDPPSALMRPPIVARVLTGTNPQSPAVNRRARWWYST